MEGLLRDLGPIGSVSAWDLLGGGFCLLGLAKIGPSETPNRKP